MGASGVATVAQPVICEAWQPAHRVILMFCSLQAGLRCHRASSEFFGGHEVLFSAFYCKHVGDHLSGYGERRPILVPSLSFSLIDQSQFVAVSRSQFRSLHENLLNVLVPLFGDGHSNQLVRGASLCAAEPTIADGLLDRLEAGDIADLKSPGERSDWPNAGHC